MARGLVELTILHSCPTARPLDELAGMFGVSLHAACLPVRNFRLFAKSTPASQHFMEARTPFQEERDGLQEAPTDFCVQSLERRCKLGNGIFTLFWVLFSSSDVFKLQ